MGLLVLEGGRLGQTKLVLEVVEGWEKPAGIEQEAGKLEAMGRT